MERQLTKVFLIFLAARPVSEFVLGTRRGRKVSLYCQCKLGAIETSAVTIKSGRALQPAPLAKCREINSRRGIPSRRAITSAKPKSDILVAIRNPQRRPCRRIWFGGHRCTGGSISLSFSGDLRRLRRFRSN